MTAQTALRVDRIALSLFAAFALLVLLGPLARLPYWTELPNEGWNGVHAMHAFMRALYPASPAWLINNYPPLWFYLTGALGLATGDPILAGRAVAMTAFFATALAIFALLRRLNTSVAASLVGALTFVVIVAGLLDVYVGLSEPQMLAHALVTASVALLVGAARRPVVVLAAIGVALGIFVKPIVIALPLAATLWLVTHRRALLSAWVVSGATASVAALAACLIAYGAPFATNLTFPRVLTLERFGTNLALISKAAAALAAFAWVVLRPGAWRDAALQFAACAIGAAVLEILLFGGALGVSINIVFDLVIAAAIGVGLVYDRLTDIARATHLRVALLSALVLRVAIGMPNPLHDLSAAGRAELQAQQDAVREVVTRLRPLKGPVACEALSACVWAGHASEADLWKLRFESTLAGLDKAALLDAVRAGRFAAVVTYASLTSRADDHNLPGLYAALERWYDPPLKAGSAFLIFVRRPR